MSGVRFVLCCLGIVGLCVIGYQVWYDYHRDKKFDLVLAVRKSAIEKNANALLYGSLNEELSMRSLPVQGTMPSWLEGLLVRVGPAQFETAKQPIQHAFDGFAMVHAFSFKNGNVAYANKFLQTNYYKDALKTGYVSSGFCSDPCGAIFSYATTLFSKVTSGSSSYDNANINVMKLADEFIAMTETPLAIRFDTRLATKGHHAFNAVLPGTITTAHPHIDYETGVLFNYLTQLGINSSYTIYTIDLATGKQQHVASISAEKPSYMHSFSLTKNYIILTEIPLRVSPIIALFSNEPFIKNFVWEPEVGTWFTIVHRRTGELVGRYRTEPFFMFHQINAFEEGDTIIVDLVVYDDPSIIQSFLVDDALSGLGKQIRFQPTRYSLNMSDRSVTVRHLASVDLEMPRIYYEKYTMQPYSFVYGMSGWNLNDPEHMLMKVNVRDGSVLRWSAPRCFPGEPVFVPTPDGSAEDDGILLCVVLDTKVRSSFLLVLDAKTMQEVGRAQVPHHIPFGLHGNFFKH